jgi:hypothetical protein
MRAAIIAVCLACLLSCAGAPPPKGGEPDSFSLEPKTLSAVIERIVRRLDGSLGEKGSRLAVATFARTGAQSSGSAEFGEYFSETLSSAVRTLIPRVRLYERKDLDLILRENSLAVSGLIDEKQALAIGTLVPIDALLAGTYTPLESAVDVNCRLVDISTGQILFTHTDRIRIDADVAAILAREKAGGGEAAKTAGGPSKEDECRQKAGAVSSLLRDLSTQEKVRGVVAAARAIPFDTDCGRVHFDVISAFRKYRVVDEDYRKFLLAALAGIAFPSADDRALEILKYLAADRRVDAEEWRDGLAVVRRSAAGDISRFLVVLLMTEDEKARDEGYYQQTMARIGELLALVEKGEVGLPVAVDLDTAFSEILDAFNYIYTSDNRIPAALYERVGGRISHRPSAQALVRSLLTVMYPRERDPAAKLTVLDWIARSFLERPRDEQLASDFFSFLKSFEVTEYKKKNPQELAAFPPDHLRIFIRSTRELFCPLVPLTKFRSQLEERVDFCLQNGIECAGVVPGPAQAAQLLSSPDWDTKMRAARMLAEMGRRAAPAEAALVARFADEEGGSSAEITVFENAVVQALGGIPASTPAALELLLGALASLHTGVSAAASQALATIGPPAVPVLIRGLKGDAGGVQYSCAAALGQIGPAAAEALPELEELAKSGNSDLRAAAQKAMASIRGQ